MNRERLALMVTLLKEVEAGTWEPTGATFSGQPLPLPKRAGHRFDLGDWVDEVLPDCGFSACAIGHAGMDARFNEQGLTLHWPPSALYQHYPRYALEGGAILNAWEALSVFFDLTPVQVDRLFDPSAYLSNQRTNPTAVRQRIEALLATQA